MRMMCPYSTTRASTLEHGGWLWWLWWLTTQRYVTSDWRELRSSRWQASWPSTLLRVGTAPPRLFSLGSSTRRLSTCGAWVVSTRSPFHFSPTNHQKERKCQPSSMTCSGIFAELLGRKPLFQGKDYINQITRIVDIMGSPTEDDLQNIGSEQARQCIQLPPSLPSMPFTSPLLPVVLSFVSTPFFI